GLCAVGRPDAARCGTTANASAKLKKVTPAKANLRLHISIHPETSASADKKFATTLRRAKRNSQVTQAGPDAARPAASHRIGTNYTKAARVSGFVLTNPTLKLGNRGNAG